MQLLKRVFTGLLLGASAALAHGAPACEDPGASMLWKVEAGDRNVYLFGSIHMGKADFYPLKPAVEAAFDASEHLVFEVDPASMADPSLLVEIQSRGMLPAGQTLADVLSPPVLQDLREAMTRAGLPVDTLMRMKPWLLTMTLTALQMTRGGYSPQFGLESYFMGRKPPGMDVLELESVREQIGYLEALNAESFLAYTLAGLDAPPEELERMMDAWRCADHEGLKTVLFEDFETDADPALAGLKVKLIDERNRRMAQGVRDFIQTGEGDYFVVVGAAHLLGEGSVVDLLRRAGVEVQPVRQR